ncbi:beta-3-deoxy-D-manno-oct-2-ulosonic acid transferase [Zobellella endophytica]|uniref:Beta-3-deoxy-D-manno-oct-2-ulosonic acid transferase n=1 Tax=Zobellella endophytica TaxID=2116700 RepID=A0A2P7RCT4_9GAMM|nr:capsular polysaccharide biosynthesis protein [Zobellella endophytica]PSJ48044.1 beta-3-deoxy-D-manno-oct-2-ulosonic acid transferase [Zobellella endophytica]
MLLTTSRGIWRQRRALDRFLAPLTLTRHDNATLHAVVGWGMKPNTEQARQLAAAKGLPFWQLEDGFIGYIGHPARGATRLSLIVDDVGIYYDATKPSQLEHWLSDISWWSEDWHHRAAAVRATLITQGITKYNCYDDTRLPPEVAAKLDMSRSRVLLVDQTKGDQSVRLGLADERSFTDMISAARSENPGAQLLIRTHPDVMLGKKQGYLTAMAGDDVVLLAESMNPFAIMPAVDKVYTVTSQLGFEALLCGKPVVCFGAPFYAGWGLTDDRVRIARRGEQRTLEQLLAAAYLRYCRYIDPVTEQPCTLEELIDLILVQRPPQPKLDSITAVGFSLWKRSFVQIFALRYAGNVTFSSRLPPSSAALVWGRKGNGATCDDHALWRMEDGFLRSVGLGSDLRRPGSLVIDNKGIYYDPRTPSALEDYLAGHDFSAHELALGERLVTHFREQALTKYNVGRQVPLAWRRQAGQRPVILVPGQVDDDASILLGSPFVKGNAALLQAVREAHPDAFIVFKPHPDVVSGNRQGQVPADILARCTDAVETGAGIVACLDECDAVHTLTSLTGLEALIRCKPVTVWGQPFYAGWGLTEDQYPVARRGRALPLAALVYATYAWYPTYVDYPTGLYSTPLRMAWRLARERESAREPAGPVLGWLHRRGRKLRFLWEALKG